MAEQLALEQRFGDGRAVDLHERKVPSRALVVQALGHELLARSALAMDQNRVRLAARELPDDVAQAPRRVGLADELVGVVLAFLALGQARDLAPRLHLVERATHGNPQLFEVLEGLFEVVRGPRLDRGHRALDVTEGRDHDDGAVGVLGLQLADDLDPVHVGQAQVDERHVR